jgi:hypothetical protein
MIPVKISNEIDWTHSALENPGMKSRVRNNFKDYRRVRKLPGIVRLLTFDRHFKIKLFSIMRQITFYSGLALLVLISCSENKTSNQNAVTNNPDSLAGKSTYENPADGKTYSTDGKYKEYTPEDGVKPVSGPVQPLNVILLTDQNKIPGIISIDKLADFIKDIDNTVIKELAGVKEKGQIILQFTLYADKKPKVGLSYKGDLKTENLNKVSQKVEQSSLGIRTEKDSCMFQSHYGVNEQQR